jgi:hypothetical protein
VRIDEPWRARITGADGRTVGAGVLIDTSHVLTAAHGLRRGSGPAMPTFAVASVEADDQTVAARVVTDAAVDAAILELATPLPVGRLPKIERCGPTGGRSVRFFGYSTGDTGLWVRARMIGYGGPAGGLVQLDLSTMGSLTIGAGMSGAGVVDEGTDAVIGIVAATPPTHPVRTGTPWMLPMESASAAWPDLWTAVHRMDSRSPADAAGRSAPTRLDNRTVHALVDALSDTFVLASEGGREHVLRALPRAIAAVVPRHGTPMLDVLSLVRTCLDYPGGLEALIEMVHTLEGDTPAMARVLAALPDREPS